MTADLWLLLAADGMLFVTAAVVVVDACRKRRRTYLARITARRRELGRPLTAAERWDLCE